jgi:hypothetical protein
MYGRTIPRVEIFKESASSRNPGATRQLNHTPAFISQQEIFKRNNVHPLKSFQITATLPHPEAERAATQCRRRHGKEIHS